MTYESSRSGAGSGWRGLRLRTALLVTALLAWCNTALAQSAHVFLEEGRKVKVSVQPQYPELAKKHNIKGMTRLELEIAADGSIKNIKVLGGNPVLVQASLEAVKKWKYEAAPGESTALVKFEFKPDR